MSTKKPPTKNSHLAAVIDRNIDTLLEMRRQIEKKKSAQHRVADGITNFSGSLMFAYFHVLWFVLWMIINLGWTPIPAFDPFPFGLLTMIVSLEAIFLSTFVLISQNRMTAMGEQRSDLDLQIDLLAEYEITKMLKLIDAIADHLDLKEGKDGELEDLENIVAPDVLLNEMEKKKRQLGLVDGKK